MINNVTIVGRLTKDVDLRFTSNGKAVANGTLAVNRPFKNANGETEADFINIVIWGKQAENTANYTSKGSLIGVTGRIQTRNYENNEGKRVYVTEVVAESVQFLEPKKDETTKQQSQQKTRMTGEPGSIFDDSEPINIDDSDLPF